MEIEKEDNSKNENNTIQVEAISTTEELYEKVKASLPKDKASMVKLIDFKNIEPRIENNEEKEMEAQPQTIFLPEFPGSEQNDKLEQYLQNFYFNKQGDIHKLINTSRTATKICDFFRLELEKVRISIEPNFSFEISPNLVVKEPSGEPETLTCIKINIPFEGDVMNWRYFNLLEIIPKSENIKFISQFHPLETSNKTYQAEIVIEETHTEYMIEKLMERIFSEEKRIHQEYNTFLNTAYERIEKQTQKADRIQRIFLKNLKSS